MREILLIVATVWGGSFVISVTWFSIDEWKYRRAADPAPQIASPSSAAPAVAAEPRTDHASDALTPQSALA